MGTTQSHTDRNKRVSSRGSKTNRPTFAILYGPPGSGKTSCSRQLFSKSMIHVSVDDVVERLWKESGQTGTYFDYRDRASQITDLMIDDSISKRKDVSLETTGKNISEWWFSLIRRLKENDFRIVLVYPVTKPSILSERVLRRSESQRSFGKLERQISKIEVEDFANSAAKNIEGFMGKVDKIIFIDGHQSKCNQVLGECNSKKCEFKVKYSHLISSLLREYITE